MTKSEQWMGNVLLDPQYGVPSYADMHVQSFSVFVKSIFVAQNERDYYLSQVQKEDIWNIKDEFKRALSQIIAEQNCQTQTFDDMIEQCVAQIKRMVREKTPKIQQLEGPWRMFAWKKCAEIYPPPSLTLARQ